MSNKKTLLDFYKDVYSKPGPGEWDTKLGKLWLDRERWSLCIGDNTRIFVTDLDKFPYPLDEETKENES